MSAERLLGPWVAVLGLVALAETAGTGKESFTSTAKYVELYGVERSLMHVLEDYVEAEQSRLDKLRLVLDNLNGTVSGQHFMTEENHTAASAHSVVTRLSELTSQLGNDLMNSREDGVNEWYESHSHQLPTSEDVSGIRDGLLRAQRTYDITAHKTGENASFIEMIRLGQHASKQLDWPTAMEWFRAADDLISDDPDVDSLEVPKVDVLSHYDGYAYASYKMGNLTQAIMLSEELLDFADRTNQSSKRLEMRINDNIESYTVILTRAMESDGELRPGAPGAAAKRNYEKDNLLKHEEDEMAAFRYLCQQDGNHMNASVGKLLNATQEAALPREKRFYRDTCTVVKRKSLRWSPVNVELISRGEPKVKLFRKFLTEEERLHIMEIAKGRLERSVASNGNEYVPTDFRISEVAWIQPDHDPIIERVHRRIEDATGLNLTEAEELQVSNYGIAGHYEPHMDWGKRDNSARGMRLATFMLYLADVDKGGNTAFPNLGISVHPSKGDAIFWHNLDMQDFAGNPATLHGACPVVSGSKWVANKWIHEGGNRACRA